MRLTDSSLKRLLFRIAIPMLLFVVADSGRLTYAQSSTRNTPVGGSSTRQSAPYSQGSSSRANSVGSGTAIREPVTQGSTTRATAGQSTFDRRFWAYLQRARYRNWAPVPGKTGDMYAGESPHGAFLKMYLNRTAAGNPDRLPHGSVVVKENYAPDQRTLMAITVMYRTPNYHSAAGDWYWVKYRPDGRVDQKSKDDGTAMRLSGKVKGCIECHASADGGDYAFFNDR